MNCNYENCGGVIVNKDPPVCLKHYKRWKRWGDPLGKRPPGLTTCTPAYIKLKEQRTAIARSILGDKCVRCGSKNSLEYDHIDRTTRFKPLTALFEYKLEVFIKEVKKCQMLCRRCHILKSQEEGSFKTGVTVKHGTNSYYVHGKCRCLLCKEAAHRLYLFNKITS